MLSLNDCVNVGRSVSGSSYIKRKHQENGDDRLIEDLVDFVVLVFHQRRHNELLPVLNQTLQTLFFRLLVIHPRDDNLHVAVSALQRSLERFDGNARQFA